MLTAHVKKILVLALILIAAASYWSYSFIDGGDESPLDNLTREERLDLKKNIVVLGVDERPSEEDTGRSDTLFVVMLDTDEDNVSLLSVPRDTRVKIPGYGWDKINHAFAFGGHKLTQETTEQLLGIRINNYVMIDFTGFKGLVDAIGGVDIEVEKPMSYYDEWDGFTIDLAPGMQHMDGDKAIQYVRYRDEEGDIGRIRRQQKFLRAVYDKVTSVEIISHLPALVKQANDMIDTDLSLGDMMDLAQAMHGMMEKHGKLQTATVPGLPEYIDGISYWIPDITDLRQQMAEMQGAQMTDRFRRGAERMEAEYVRNLERAKQAIEDELNGVNSDEDEDKDKKADEDKEQVKGSKEEKPEKKAVKESKKTDSRRSAKRAAQEFAGERTKEPAKEPAKEAPVVKETPKQTYGGVIRVVVIDCSGDPAKAASARERLAGMGMSVTDGGSGNAREETLIVSTTTSGRVVTRLTEAPFVHGMSISRNPGADFDGIVYVGKDYK